MPGRADLVKFFVIAVPGVWGEIQSATMSLLTRMIESSIRSAAQAEVAV